MSDLKSKVLSLKKELKKSKFFGDQYGKVITNKVTLMRATSRPVWLKECEEYNRLLNKHLDNFLDSILDGYRGDPNAVFKADGTFDPFHKNNAQFYNAAYEKLNEAEEKIKKELAVKYKDLFVVETFYPATPDALRILLKRVGHPIMFSFGKREEVKEDGTKVEHIDFENIIGYIYDQEI